MPVGSASSKRTPLPQPDDGHAGQIGRDSSTSATLVIAKDVYLRCTCVEDGEIKRCVVLAAVVEGWTRDVQHLQATAITLVARVPNNNGRVMR